MICSREVICHIPKLQVHPKSQAPNRSPLLNSLPLPFARPCSPSRFPCESSRAISPNRAPAPGWGCSIAVSPPAGRRSHLPMVPGSGRAIPGPGRWPRGSCRSHGCRRPTPRCRARARSAEPRSCSRYRGGRSSRSVIPSLGYDPHHDPGVGYELRQQLEGGLRELLSIVVGGVIPVVPVGKPALAGFH